MAIQAIETRYKGYRFRSRLEARWAVFFDSLGIRYQYEPEGFRVGSIHAQWPDQFYLPDFWLTDTQTWVEVKGSLDMVSDLYLEMIAAAVDWGGKLPGIGDSMGTTRGLLWLGNVPDVDRCHRGSPVHAIFQHSKGGWINACRFVSNGLEVISGGNNYFDSSWGDGGCAQFIRPILCRICSEPHIVYPPLSCSPNVLRAYSAARSARFEHGDSPCP